MGNLFSRNPENATQAEIKKLQNRLMSLENLDKNNDGKVSKNEFETWAKEQRINLDTFKQQIVEQEGYKHQKELLQKDTEIKALLKELESLKGLNIKQEKEHLKKRSELLRNSTIDPVQSLQSQQLSEEQIRKFVEELLQDENVNINYLPDWVERQLYINFFNLLIGLLKKTVNSTSIKFIGHQLTLDMIPISANTTATAAATVTTAVDAVTDN